MRLIRCVLRSTMPWSSRMVLEWTDMIRVRGSSAMKPPACPMAPHRDMEIGPGLTLYVADVSRPDSGGAGAVANIFWRLEDLWQSPIGDISHAVKLPVGRALRPPEIPVYRPGAVPGFTGKLRRRPRHPRQPLDRQVAFDRYVVNLEESAAFQRRADDLSCLQHTVPLLGRCIGIGTR